VGAPETERLLAGRYRLQAVIGRGGMGAVWRARDELLNRDVAVKEIIWPPQLAPAERDIARRRAVREAQLAARLHHPNIVSVYDIVDEDERPSIVMEFLPYRSLRDVVREDGPLTPAHAAWVGLGVLAALRVAHEAGVVHRDVKPANILLDPAGRAGRVVLTDFGIAKAADSPTLTSSGMLLGSPSYLAPERARGEPGGAAADLWALGASLYVAVEGHPPFERDTVLASLTAVVADDPEYPSRAGALWPVISGLLQKDQEARLTAPDAELRLRHVAAADTPAPPPRDEQPRDEQSRDEQQEAAPVPLVSLESLLHDDGFAPSPERPTPPPTEPAHRSRRSRRSLVTGAAVAAAAVAAAVFAIGLAVMNGKPGTHGTSPAAVTAPRPRTTSASASASSTPSPSRPVQATGSASNTVPAGYYRFTNSTGFSIGVPQGWQISHVGHYVYVRDPADAGIFLLIDQSDQPKPNPLADWQQQAANRQGTYPDYHLIEMQAVSYRPQAEKAADWEFTYDRGGVTVQVLNRNILANAQHAYALYWSTPAADWNADYHYFQAFAATFRPAS
jgi:eukaryotic-like serine/threonine-protein kinase